VEHMIQFILQGQNEELKIKLLTDCNLISRICEASKLNDEDCLKPRGLRRGYMGFLTLITNTIIQLGVNNTAVEQLLTADDQWQKYVKGSFEIVREKERRSLGGYSPTEFHDEDLVEFEPSQQEYMNKRDFPELDDDSDEDENETNGMHPADQDDDEDEDDDEKDDDDDESDDDDSDDEAIAEIQETMIVTSLNEDDLQGQDVFSAGASYVVREESSVESPAEPVPIPDFAQFDAFLSEPTSTQADLSAPTEAPSSEDAQQVES